MGESHHPYLKQKVLKYISQGKGLMKLKTTDHSRLRYLVLEGRFVQKAKNRETRMMQIKSGLIFLKVCLLPYRCCLHRFQIGSRPPVPQGNFRSHWAFLCQGEWHRALAMFSCGTSPLLTCPVWQVQTCSLYVHRKLQFTIWLALLD